MKIKIEDTLPYTSLQIPEPRAGTTLQHVETIISNSPKIYDFHNLDFIFKPKYREKSGKVSKK